jgi:hypothetical protein
MGSLLAVVGLCASISLCFFPSEAAGAGLFMNPHLFSDAVRRAAARLTFGGTFSSVFLEQQNNAKIPACEVHCLEIALFPIVVSLSSPFFCTVCNQRLTIF